MKILKINKNNPNVQSLNEAVQCLKNGGVLVYPTDTCYGLGADITNPIAIKKIYEIKGRSDRKPLSIIVRNLSQLKKIAIVDDFQEQILKKYLPGNFTFILLNSDLDTFNQTSIGIRIPKFKLTQLISDKFSEPYATTSANISGKQACYSIDNILKQFKHSNCLPDLFLDAGELPCTKPSTIVDLTRQPFKIIRQGSGKFDE